ncbi:hypothetical protein ACC808_37695, partial [Rhizobium ruizarguesonis]
HFAHRRLQGDEGIVDVLLQLGEGAQEAAMRAKRDDLQSSMSVVVAAAAAGDLGHRISKDYEDDNINQLAGNINTLLS